MKIMFEITTDHLIDQKAFGESIRKSAEKQGFKCTINNPLDSRMSVSIFGNDRGRLLAFEAAVKSCKWWTD